MISVRFPYALTSQAGRPELGFNALDAFEGFSETDIHHVVIRHRLLKLLDMWSVWITDAAADVLRLVLPKQWLQKPRLRSFTNTGNIESCASAYFHEVDGDCFCNGENNDAIGVQDGSL